MLKLEVNENAVKILGKGGTPEILADFIAVYVSLGISIAEKLKVSPKNGMLHLYQLAAEYLAKNPIKEGENDD